MPKGKILMGKKTPSSSISNLSADELERFKAAIKYSQEINAIVNAGPGKPNEKYFSNVYATRLNPNGPVDYTVSSRNSGRGRMTKEGALAARASKTLRGTQKKAK